MKKETLAKITQFVKFGIVGFSNNVIFYLVNLAVLFMLKNQELSWDYMAGNIAGFLVSVLWSYYWNSKYVFKQGGNEKRSALKTLIKTYLAYGFTGIVLNNALSYLWISILGISKLIAPLINLFITVPVNFIMNKLWAFRSSVTGEEKNDSSAC